MLTETFIASVGVQSNAHRTDIGRDVAIAVFEHQPIVQVHSSFKKSLTPPHCLAASANHVFAAQQAKAVVHVYNRETGSQEATVPFPERITCIALACADTVLIVATCEGKIFLWETTTGRQVQTLQTHLQSVTALAVDTCSSYFVSTSDDTTAQVWFISHLLAFDTDIESRSPALSFSAHHTPIVDVALGHSHSNQNFAVTVSDDATCLVWSIHDGSLLATLLLAEKPVAIQLDAADRAVYVAYNDASLQQIDLHEGRIHKTRSTQSNGQSPIQPGDKRRWRLAESADDSIVSMSVSFDSTLVLTGHQSGTILSWDVATGHARSLPIHPPLPGAVTNLQPCPLAGSNKRSFTTPLVVKPKFNVDEGTAGTVPLQYAMSVHLTQPLHLQQTTFLQALTNPTVPQEMIDQGLEGLAQWKASSQANSSSASTTDDYMALDSQQNDTSAKLTAENAELKRQLVSLRQVQLATFDQMDKLAAERAALLDREHKRLTRSHSAVDD